MNLLFNKKALLLNFLAIFTPFFQANAMEPLRSRDTVELQRLASLLFEQQFFMESLDAIEIERPYPFDSLNTDVARQIRYTSHLAEADMEKHKKHISSLGASFKPDHLSLAHLCATLKTDNLYADIIKELKAFPQEKILEPLQCFIARLESYKPMCVTDSQFLASHNALYQELSAPCEQYRSLLSEIKRYYDAILTELMGRQRKGFYSFRRHYFADHLLPESYQMSTAYLPMFEKQSKSIVDSLLVKATNAPQAQQLEKQPHSTPKVSRQERKEAARIAAKLAALAADEHQSDKAGETEQDASNTQQTWDIHDIYSIQEFLFPGSLIPKQ